MTENNPLRQNARIGCAILVGLHVLAILFWYFGGFSASLDDETRSLSYKDAFEMADYIGFFYFPIVVTLVAGLLAALPLASRSGGKGWLTLSLILDILAFAYCTFMIVGVLNEATEDMYGFGVSYSITIMGILHFICGLVMIVCQFIVRRKLKRAIAAERSGVYAAPASWAPPVGDAPSAAVYTRSAQPAAQSAPEYTGYKQQAAPSAPAETGARFCTGCGSPLTPGSNFCGVCGKKN